MTDIDEVLELLKQPASPERAEALKQLICPAGTVLKTYDHTTGSDEPVYSEVMTE